MADTTFDSATAYDVLVAGGGVAGLTAALYTARAGLSTLVVAGEEPILARNAHLENFPGFPAGVNPRLFVDMLHDQADRNGVSFSDGRVDSVAGVKDDFVATLSNDETVTAARVVAASWADADYLGNLDVEVRDAGSKRYVVVDEVGRTTVPGIYAAGRLAETYHQTVVAAGHGAEAAITLIHDADVPYYHDWVAPEGYFTGRDREIPPGCEEIDAEEQARRQAEARETMRDYFADPHPETQRTHPSLVDDDRGRVDADWEEADD